jgi:hypothetical protein
MKVSKVMSKWNLVHEYTGASVTAGDWFTLADGEDVQLTGWKEPRHPDNYLIGARVYVRTIDDTFTSEFFPSVLGLVFQAADAQA